MTMLYFRAVVVKQMRGVMAEWTKAVVLKTTVAQATGGSNPSSSAIFFRASQGRCQSGRLGPPAKRLTGKTVQGFESLPSRHLLIKRTNMRP